MPARRRLPNLVALLLLAFAVSCSRPSPTPSAVEADDPAFETHPGAIYRSHVEFGIPADGNTTDDFVIHRRTHSFSHDCGAGGPNWVSWNLNRTHYGAAPRTASFYADTGLRPGCYRVVSSDYTSSGYSRGHMVRSEERTSSGTDNKETFYMTNVLPQHQHLNGGPWYRLEQHLQELAQGSNKELYVIAGGTGNKGTLRGEGKVVIPAWTWKIVVVMPYGQGLADVTSTSSIQVIAVKMPNVSGISTNDWTMYRTTVDEIENLTTYDFLAKLPDGIEAHWEAKVY